VGFSNPISNLPGNGRPGPRIAPLWRPASEWR